MNERINQPNERDRTTPKNVGRKDRWRGIYFPGTHTSYNFRTKVAHSRGEMSKGTLRRQVLTTEAFFKHWGTN
jgi:hypothetical protein